MTVLRAWAVLSVIACGSGDAGVRRAAPRPRPDELPAMVNTELPFRYPASLYTRRAQGNVTLRLFIDQDGRVAPESTHVAESSGFPAMDSAAVTGARDLRFVPAKLHGEPMAMAVLFPVFFRHPEAPPVPGDSALKNPNRA